jgi:hypothetical protein
MQWRKLGLLFSADHQFPWMATHAANPAVDVVNDNYIRVYFSTRDPFNRSHIATVDIELNPVVRVCGITSAPLLSPGPPGAFDDSGVSMGCIAKIDATIILYYLGWNLGVTVPWRNSIGAAISKDNGQTFSKVSPAPILDRNSVDPYSLSYPWILQCRQEWLMWYGSNLRWGKTEREMDHVIKVASSANGIDWKRDGHIAISLQAADEYAIARPSVIADGFKYRMWFAHRGKTYRIGYAESEDAISWRRDDRSAGIEPSQSGWDSEMLTYPCVFKANGIRYLIYNGNGYGRSGFGLAVEE